MIRALRDVLFPCVCRRCRRMCDNYMCHECMLGIELGERRRNAIHLFDDGLGFYTLPFRDKPEIIGAFAVIQLSRHRITFGKIECEPELIFLKKYLLKKMELNGEKTLFLVHRERNPILKRPITKYSYVLVV